MSVDNQQPNYYDVLSVDRSASVDDIRHQYRRLMQAGAHPDLGGDPLAAALLNKAYAVLSDAARRAAYDAAVHEALVSATPPRVIDPARECVFCTLPHAHQGRPDASCVRCGSPLSPVERVRLEARDQRAIARIDRRLDVSLFADWRQDQPFAGRSEDLSLQGMRLVTRRSLPQGHCVRIVSGVFDAVGGVTNAYTRKTGWRKETVAGISFLTLRFSRSVGGFVSRRV